VKAKALGVMALWVAGLGAGSAILGCRKEASPTTSAAEKAADQKTAADKAAADAAASKAALDKAAADKAAADKAAAAAAAAKAAADADKAAAVKEAADQAVADKVAADKAAAEKAAAQATAEAAMLPPDLVETKAEISRTMAQLDLTMAQLEALAATTGDLEDPADKALEAMELLKAETDALQARGEEMRNRGAAYFEEWEKQLAAMSTPEVVAIAMKRKDELSAMYAELLTGMQESRVALDAFWADMKPIHDALDDGLTPESQKLLGPQVKTAKEKAATLKTRVEAMFAKVNQVSLIYSKP
jgi:chromosome segregation ATPase